MNPVAAPSAPTSLAGPAPGPRSADPQPHGGASTPFAKLLERSAPPPAAPHPGASKTAGGAASVAAERASSREASAPSDEQASQRSAVDDRETAHTAEAAAADLLGANGMPPVIVDKASLRADTATLEGGSVAVQGTVGGAVPTAAQSPSSASEVSRDALREAADAGTRPGGLEARDAPGSKLDPSAREIAVAGKPERPAGRPTDADTPVGRPGDDPTRIDTQAPSREPSSVLPRAERVEIQPGATGAPTGGPTALAQAALAHGPLDALPGRLVTEAASPMPQVHLPMAPQAPAFASALGAQLRMWVRDGVQQAVLQLNPADLGPVAVQIALDGSRAHVDFVAAQAATRSALEASLPTLAAALRDSGLTLAGGGVFDQPRGGRDDSAPQGRRGNDAPGGEVASLAQASPAVVVRARGVVDLVA